MSNISLELNFELYKHLVDIYNIPLEDYAPDHVFDAAFMTNTPYSGYGSYYAYDNSTSLSENFLMSITFSKFYTDKNSNEKNARYINYILKENYSSYIDYAADVSVSYYENDMISKNEKPYVNNKIIDFDITSYAAYNIRYYVFYLDIISQIYQLAYDRKRNKLPIIAETINIKGRYSLQSINSILQRCDIFNITLKPILSGINSDVIDVEYTADRNISYAFTTFKADIIRHLKYLSGEDVRLTGLSYLKTIEYFYKFCRLRIMYLVAHCIRLLDDPSGNISSKFNNFILEEVLAVFTNFRDTVNKNVIQSDDLKMTKNMLYNKSVIDTSTKLQDINDQIIANRDYILNNESLLSHIDAEYTNTYRMHLTATVMLFITVIVGIILISLKQVGDRVKANISLGITIILVMFIIVLYIANSSSVIEKFEDTLQIEQDIIKFPRSTLLGPKTTYADGTIVNVKTSASNACAYSIFNNGRLKQNFASSCSSGWSGSRNSWIAIDLGEYVILKGFNIFIYNTDRDSSAPKNVSLYGSKSSNAYASPFNGSTINNQWVLIPTSALTYGVADNKGNAKAQVNIDTDNNDYPYYMLQITSAQNNGNTINLKYWELYGVRKYSVAPVITDTISGITTVGGPKEFIPRPLPIDYSDNKLISWDLTLTSSQNSSECVSLSMGTFCFNNTRTKELRNQTYFLDPYGTQYITGFVETVNKDLNNVSYSLVIRYYPTVVDNDQLAKLIDFANMDQGVNEKRELRDAALAALQRTSNILNASNLKISDYSEQIDDMQRSSNAARIIRQNNQLYSQSKLDYDTSNEMLVNLKSTSNSYLRDLAISEENLRKAKEEYRISSDLNAKLSTTFNTLKGDITKSINYFRQFMDQSEKTLADNVTRQIVQGNVEKLRVDLLNLDDVGKDSIDTMTSNIIYQDAEKRRKLAEQQAEISRKSTTSSFLNSEAFQLEFENKRLQDAISGSDAIIANFEGAIDAETTRKEQVESQIGAATLQKQEAELAAASKLGQINLKYGTNYATLDELNEALNDKLKAEKALKATAEQEYSDLEYEQRVAQHKLNNANIMIAFYDGLAAQTDASIKVYDGYIGQFESNLQDLQREKVTLEATLSTKRASSEERTSAALQSYAEIENSTFQNILLLKVEHNTLLLDIARRRAEEAEKYKEFLAKRKEKDTAEEKYRAIIKQKEAEISTRDYYKTVRDAIKDDVDISIVIKDIDLSMIYSINDNINGINYDLITPNMSSEYYEFDKYRKSMQVSAYKSEFDVNNKVLEIRGMEAKTVLFLNLSLIIMICITIYYYLSSHIAALIAIVAIMIAIIMYAVKMRGPVRSRARNYYWT